MKKKSATYDARWHAGDAQSTKKNWRIPVIKKLDLKETKGGDTPAGFEFEWWFLSFRPS